MLLTVEQVKKVSKYNVECEKAWVARERAIIDLMREKDAENERWSRLRKEFDEEKKNADQKLENTVRPLHDDLKAKELVCLEFQSLPPIEIHEHETHADWLRAQRKREENERLIRMEHFIAQRRWDAALRDERIEFNARCKKAQDILTEEHKKFCVKLQEIQDRMKLTYDAYEEKLNTLYEGLKAELDLPAP